MSESKDVLHWYDFLCPFCYVGQSRTAVLARDSMNIMELPFQAHPDIPPGGVAAGPRVGLMYSSLEREAREAGLTLNWPSRIPDTRRAPSLLPNGSGVMSRTNLHNSTKNSSLLILSSVRTWEAMASSTDMRPISASIEALRAALADGSAIVAVDESEVLGRQYGVRGTPAWWIAGQLISGLLPAQEFECLAERTRLQFTQ